MLFDQTAPSSAYWTPPKLAKGWDKTRLALFGYGADGQQNGWGKLSSWIPGLGVGLNVAAQKDAKNEGLTEVSTNIGQDLDNRLQKLQTLVQVGKTAFSAATGNIAGVASGVQGITQGISGTMQTQDNNLALNGTQAYGRYKDGGKVPAPKPKSVAAASSTATPRPMITGMTRMDMLEDNMAHSIANPARAAEMNDSARQGSEYVQNWVRARARAGQAGLTPADQNISAAIKTPSMATSRYDLYANKGLTGEVRGYYDQISNKSVISPAMTPEGVYSTSAHESTHQLQNALGANATDSNQLHPAWEQTQNLINQELRTSSKDYDDGYLNTPQEVHARIMQVRQANDLMPRTTITPEKFKAMQKTMTSEGGTSLGELRQVLDDHQIIRLMNKTVGNQVASNSDLFRAKEGGKITIYDKHDDTEDIHMIDKKTGEKIGEMRYGERIFDQEATIKMEELADKKDDHALGAFLRRELNTHADRKGAQLFAGGGKPFNTASSSGMNAMLDRFKNMPGPTNTQIEASKGFMGSLSDNAEEGADWFGMAGDGLRSITSAVGAAQQLPTRPVNSNLLQMQRELADKQNEGLSASERINLLRQKAATQAYEVQSIRDTAGGGGSGAAVLGATNKADLRANQMGVEIEQADAAQRAQNKQNYYNDLQTTQGQSDALYSQQYNNALSNRNAFATALGANLQNMADRNQYDQSYGKGSPYYNLMLEMMKRTGKTQAFADAPVTAGVLAKQ